MSEKMELAELAQKFRNNASAVLTGDQVADEILNWAADFTIVRASSPAQEPVTTEPVAWQNIDRIICALETAGCCRNDYVHAPEDVVAHALRDWLLSLPAPPQPGREWQPIVGMEWPAEPVLLGFWYQGEFKQYISTHAPEGWVAAWMESPRQYFPDHIQAWFTHWRPLPAPPAGEPE